MKTCLKSRDQYELSRTQDAPSSMVYRIDVFEKNYLELICFVVHNLNSFPSQNGISETLSPLTIVRGEGPADLNQYGLEFGSYAQVFNEQPTTNSMAARTTDAIALCSTAAGAQYFLNLETGKRILRRQATPLTVPLHVIE